MVMSIFDHAYLQIIEITFSFLEFPPACKISVYSIYSFLSYVQFQSPLTRLAVPIFHHTQPKIFDHFLISMNLSQHAQNDAILFVLEIWLIKKSCNLIG